MSATAVSRVSASDLQSIVDELLLARTRLLDDEQRAEIAELTRATFEAADGDSNDDEIAALQAFRDDVLVMLGIAESE
jgi:glycerol-3-phosphate cytidylyltransferase-like family protein